MRRCAVFTVRTQTFEGPLELLVALVREARLSVYEVSVAEIVELYLRYVEELQGRAPLEELSEFVALAAALMRWKSRALLPGAVTPESEQVREAWEEELTSQEDFYRRLVTYRRYQIAREALVARLSQELPRFSRSAPGEALRRRISTQAREQLGATQGDLTPPMSPEHLSEAWRRIFRRRRERAAVRSVVPDPYEVLEFETRICRHLLWSGEVAFADLIPPGAAREFVVTAFLAVLELLRKGKIRVRQEGPFSDLLLVRRETDDPPRDSGREEGGEGSA
ncbi:MAG: segregation/condensation protein A [Brockia lithotrophica]|nr:segregation/condensation protein A [Brockia lithotrophica]